MASGKPFCLSGLFFQLGPGVILAWLPRVHGPKTHQSRMAFPKADGVRTVSHPCQVSAGFLLECLCRDIRGWALGLGCHILLPKKHHEGSSDLNIRDINSTYKRERLKKSYCKRQRYRQGNNRYYFFFFTNNLMKNVKQTKRSQARNQTKTKI